MSGKKEAPRPAPTLQVRVWFQGQIVATAEVPGGLNSMMGAK
jgi:hypothetical protein